MNDEINEMIAKIKADYKTKELEQTNLHQEESILAAVARLTKFIDEQLDYAPCCYGYIIHAMILKVCAMLHRDAVVNGINKDERLELLVRAVIYRWMEFDAIAAKEDQNWN